jgi:hypothetical protein
VTKVCSQILLPIIYAQEQALEDTESTLSASPQPSAAAQSPIRQQPPLDEQDDGRRKLDGMEWEVFVEDLY